MVHSRTGCDSNENRAVAVYALARSAGIAPAALTGGIGSDTVSVWQPCANFGLHKLDVGAVDRAVDRHMFAKAFTSLGKSMRLLLSLHRHEQANSFGVQ
jgi:hypothetical protein